MNHKTGAYDAGEAAGRNGEPHWRNPHTNKRSGVELFLWWYAGWCEGRQKLQNHQEANEKYVAEATE